MVFLSLWVIFLFDFHYRIIHLFNSCFIFFPFKNFSMLNFQQPSLNLKIYSKAILVVFPHFCFLQQGDLLYFKIKAFYLAFQILYYNLIRFVQVFLLPLLLFLLLDYMNLKNQFFSLILIVQIVMKIQLNYVHSL